ncbi:MAG TPA: HD domain-containing phosphohydrolase [Casimicrobiaceae bacterium]|nr:HD domain-containing phosphohydrolase [Casimicrobiaceae bacterium]
MDELVKATAALVRALTERDGNTSAHSCRTRTLALELGKVCGLSAAELATLGLAAQLHDIGKIGVPDRILLKPGRLDSEELELMRSHPRRGYDILMAVPDPEVAAVADVVLHHHEGFDGMGYPSRLKGEEIPVSSRIVTIVDSYDALAAQRPYKKPKTHERIMHILFEEEGGKYDPFLRTKFAALIEASAHKAGSS